MIEQTIIAELEEASSVLRNFIEQEKKHNSIAKAANLILSISSTVNVPSTILDPLAAAFCALALAEFCA